MTEEEKKSNIEALKEKDRRSDLKSFCKYILEKIGDLKTNSSDRAIWELCQNARDLSDGATIKITLDEGKLTFAHKGMPFNDDSLISLVKQVSSNSKEGEDSAGQFGTGFVTTHDFSRKIYINGSFQTNSGSYIDIDNFELDRSIDEIDAFIKAMDNQIQSVYDLMEKDESPCREWTEFIYPLTPEKQVKVQIALSVSEKMMPYVLVINDRIKTVTIHKTAHNTDDVVTFTKSESAYTVDNLYCREVYIARQGKDTETFKVFYLQEDDNMVILPLSDSRMAKNVDGISKLFVWFPLLETEDFGTSFIYHSKFYPLEPRNGIVLPCDNDNVKSKYTYNTERVAALDNMLFEYLKTHVSQISNTIELAKVNFLANITKDEKTLDFYNTRQKAWTSVLRSLPLIDTLVGRKSLDDGVKVLNATMCTFFSDEENYTKYFDSFYEFAVSAATLPVKDECLRWSKIIHEWNLEDGESHYLQLKTVAEKVSKQNDISKLHDLLEIFKACASQEDNLFDNYSLIPNREGELRKKKELYDGKTINDFLYARAKAIAPEAMATLVNPAFCGHLRTQRIYSRPHEVCYRRSKQNDEAQYAESQHSFMFS